MFDYIIDKIIKSDFDYTPFKHLYIENFLSDDHFQILKYDSQISLRQQNNTIDHTKLQRTQLYGNLWYSGRKKSLKKIYYKDLLSKD